MSNNSDSHELLSVVAAVHHERVGQSLNDGAVGLAESLGGISAGGVSDVDGVSQGNIVTIAGSPSASRPPEGIRNMSKRTSGRCRGPRHRSPTC